MQGYNIAVVDDDQVNLHILCKNLKKSGAEVMPFANGEDFLKSTKEFVPDLVLLDLMMPGLSGLEVLEVLRENYTPMQLPVIMVTIRAEIDTVVKAFELGANDYITKPYNLNEVAARTTTQLNLAKSYKEHIRLEQLESINAIVATFCHEINNPLTIAKYNMEQITGDTHTEKALKSIERIQELVKNIQNLSVSNNVQLQYVGDYAKMVKVK